jgi:predicted transposase YbfD/YdcC
MTRIDTKELRGIIGCFKDLSDPRSPVNRLHLLVDVIVISIGGVIAGADGPVGIAEWAQAQKAWLHKHLQLPNGIPSHDTIGRVLEALQPEAFQECFLAWLQSLMDAGEGGEHRSAEKQIAIDGKTLRRSHDRRRGLKPLHLVSAWATQEGITLGQLATEEKSNEITAIPELLDRLDLENAIVTIDAAGCQKNIAAKIIEGGGDYVLALKGNQETLYQAIQNYFDEQVERDFVGVPVSYWEEQERSHGRLDKRYYYQLTVPADLVGRKKWRGLKTLGVAIRISEANGVETIDTRFYISSLRRSIKRFARFVRGHWGIESTLHWILDMTFREDESRVRGRRSADNLSWLRRLSLTLLKKHPAKKSIAMKRRIAGWNVDFLMQVLTGTDG